MQCTLQEKICQYQNLARVAGKPLSYFLVKTKSYDTSEVLSKEVKAHKKTYPAV